MGNKPITKVARPNYDARYTGEINLSFSSEWKTPKIFKQTSSGWNNPLGYIPSFMGFRQLNDGIPITGLPLDMYRNGGFTTEHFTHSISSLQSDPDLGGVTFAFGDLWVSKFSGWGFGNPWEDENQFALLFLDPLDGEPPLSYELKEGGAFLLGAGDVDVREAFPYFNSMDSRFDSFKIFKTGTLELSLPAETIVMNGDPVSHIATVEHNLGYPPVYLPEAGCGWILDSMNVPESFVVNDYLGMFPGGFGGGENPILDVYVDSDNLYMRYTRFSRSWENRVFNSGTVTLYYTIFYNEIGEEFDFLDI
jgi:hypothetical protein